MPELPHLLLNLQRTERLQYKAACLCFPCVQGIIRRICKKNDISDSAFRNWLKQYEQGGLEALARADAEIKEILPEGLDRTEENYRREILKLRIENERLKKNYTVRTNEAGEQEYIHLRPKNTQ